MQVVCMHLFCHPITSPSASQWWEVSEQLESPSTSRRCSRFLLMLSNFFIIGTLLSANANASPFPHRSWESCLLWSPQASARAWVSLNAIQSDRIHLEEASIWADDSNFTFKTRQPDGGTLPAPAGGPPELAQRRPHPVPGLGEQCKDELMKVKVQR